MDHKYRSGQDVCLNFIFLIIIFFCLRLASMSWIMAAGLIVNAAMGVSF
jgi:hypothetical protein